MKSFSELEKISKSDMSGLLQVKMAVLGDCATQHLCRAIRGQGYEEGVAITVWESDYDQIELQLVDGGSQLYKEQPEIVFLMMCQEKLYESYVRTDWEKRSSFADRTMDRLRGYWNMVMTHSDAVIFQSNFTLIDDGIFGGLANKVEGAYVYQLRKLNYLLMQEAACAENGNGLGKRVHVIDLDLLQQADGAQKLHDHRTYFVGKLPFAVKSLPAVAKLVVDTVKALKGKVKKCVITDLDNTLWGGVIGDDGIENIQIGELGQGQAFTRLQVWLKELKNRGILLAVCSKNEEETAKLPFVKHPEMVLKLSDFAVFTANWEDKAGNIRKIQETLNIGMDSIVFLDDNPFERELVKSLIPEICVPELPQDPGEYLPYLKSLNLFESAGFSEEDRERTGQYQAESARVCEKNRFANYEDYLESLEMTAQAKPFDEFHIPRIAQLSQRSNQFNLRTVRYTENDVEKLSKDPDCLTLYFTLKDKFGDHGLIGVVVLEKQSEDTLFVSQWLMSCRVLKRGMEEFIADTIIKRAAQNGYLKVEGEYLATPKNKMVEGLYLRMGFESLGNNRYQADINKYQEHRIYIREEE